MEKTLTSLGKLTLPHEVIISDGKSKDRTAEIARRFTNKVVVHTEDRRQTIAEGRNMGAAAMDASSQFAVFIDADCTIFEPDIFFTKLLTRFEEDPKLVAMNVAIRVLPENETISDWIIFGLFNKYLCLVNNVFHFAVSAGEFQMIRKISFDKIGGYDPRLVAAEDVDLFQRLSKIGNVRFGNGLTIYHTGRRAHKIGLPKLLWLWILNPLWMMVRGRSYSAEWHPIR